MPVSTAGKSIDNITIYQATSPWVTVKIRKAGAAVRELDFGPSISRAGSLKAFVLGCASDGTPVGIRAKNQWHYMAMKLG